jgi:sugar phosphate isomerase/epimerase
MRGMQIGVCTSPDRAFLASDAGADYLELSCSAVLQPDLPDAAFDPLLPALHDLPLPVKAFNIFINRGRLIGPEADPARLRSYIQTAARRAAALGAEVIVVGSGAARRMPDGMPPTVATAEFKRILEQCAKAGAEHGIVFCVEPLNTSETNFLINVPSAVEMAESIGSRNVRIVVDSYHMEVGAESMPTLIGTNGMIAHAHTAGTGRLPPGRGAYDHRAFFEAMRIAGFAERVSIECRWDDFASEIGPAVAHLREALRR